jgi:DNA-binding NarL/FixJ family response regulator
MTITVGIIEDERDIRESLKLLINGSEGFACEHVYANAEDAIREIGNLKLDVVLTDINLPGKSGIECIHELKPQCPDTNFLICTSFDDSENVFKALKAGATGYLTKTIQPSKLLDAIEEVHNGGSPMNSHIARQVVMSFNETNNHPELAKLSQREMTILELLSKGLRYKEIADRLYLSTETVRTHIRNIYSKLQVNSRTDALNKVFRR